MKEKGTVKWFNGAKGYGFIQRSTGEDVFVHFSAIQESGYRSLNEGETVEFEVTKGPKGLLAATLHARRRLRQAKDLPGHSPYSESPRIVQVSDIATNPPAREGSLVYEQIGELPTLTACRLWPYGGNKKCPPARRRPEGPMPRGKLLPRIGCGWASTVGRESGDPRFPRKLEIAIRQLAEQ